MLGDYYPRLSANGICVEAIIRCLQGRKYDVFCLSNKQYLGKRTKNIQLVRMPIHLYLNDVTRQMSDSVYKKILKRICRLADIIALFFSTFFFSFFSTSC